MDGMNKDGDTMTETHGNRTETHACDLISKEAAIDSLAEWHDVAITNRFNNLPSAQPTLYGYDLRSLIIFADAVKKNGVAESEMNDFATNAKAAWKYAWEEFQRTQKEALDSIMRGDYHANS